MYYPRGCDIWARVIAQARHSLHSLRHPGSIMTPWDHTLRLYHFESDALLGVPEGVNDARNTFQKYLWVKQYFPCSKSRSTSHMRSQPTVSKQECTDRIC